MIKVETAAKEKVVLETQEADPEVVNPLEAQMAQTDTTASDSTSLETPGVSSFFALQQQGSENGFFYNLADTSRINRALKNDRIVRIIPQNLDFKWGVKPEEGTELLQLFPIKVGRNGKAPLTGEVITDARQSLDDRARPSKYANERIRC